MPSVECMQIFKVDEVKKCRSQEMSSSFKYIVVKIKNKDDGKLRNVVALYQWYDSSKQKCRFSSVEQMEYLDLQKILKSSCSPQKSWPANQVLEVYNQTGMVNIHLSIDFISLIANLYFVVDDLAAANRRCERRNENGKTNDTDAGKKRTRKLPAKFQDEQHCSPQKKQKAEKTIAQERNETEIAVLKEKKKSDRNVSVSSQDDPIPKPTISPGLSI